MQCDTLTSVFGEFCAISLNMSEDDHVADPGNPSSAQAPLRADISSRTVSSGLKIELPPLFKGDGTEFFTNWSRRFEVAVRAMHMPDANIDNVLAAVLPTRLADAAFLYWDSLPPATQKNYADVKKQLLDVFGPKHTLPFFQTSMLAHAGRGRLWKSTVQTSQGWCWRLFRIMIPMQLRVRNSVDLWLA